MADTELVIKIPDRIYYGIEKDITVNGSRASQIVLDAVKNGILLPKGHEDLIEKSCLHDFRKYLNTCPQGCNEDDETWFTSSEIDNRIEQYPTIIEANKEEE